MGNSITQLLEGDKTILDPYDRRKCVEIWWHSLVLFSPPYDSRDPDE